MSLSKCCDECKENWAASDLIKYEEKMICKNCKKRLEGEDAK